MRVKIYTFTPLRRALVEGIPQGNDLFEAFVPGLAPDPAIGLAGDRIAGRPPLPPAFGALRAAFHALDVTDRPLDYIGFETADRPFQIDFMTADRLKAEFPEVLRIRTAHVAEWQSPLVAVPADTFAAARDARRAMSTEDRGRFLDWLSHHDVVLTPMRDLRGDASRRIVLERLEAFTGIVRDIGCFRRVPRELMLGLAQWPTSTATIMRAAVFREFFASLKAVLTALDEQWPGGIAAAAGTIAERLLGVYVQALFLVNPLVRIGRLPLIKANPSAPPAGLPADFDPARYLAFNPDVAKAGMDPGQHYLAFGWREDRDWGRSCA